MGGGPHLQPPLTMCSTRIRASLKTSEVTTWGGQSGEQSAVGTPRTPPPP